MGTSSGGKPASRQKSHLNVFVADIQKSEPNVRLANKPKPNIAHEYPSLSKYILLGCMLYQIPFETIAELIVKTQP